MIKYLKTFFYPTVLTYSYNHPKEFVIAKITEVLKKKVTFLSSHDMKGNFLSPDTFVISTISPANTKGVKYGSILVGQIIECEKGITEIKTKAKPSVAYYFIFFMTLLFGFAYLYKFVKTGSAGILFWSLVILLVGPALTIGLSNVAIVSVQKRFKMYIDKELKS